MAALMIAVWGCAICYCLERYLSRIAKSLESIERATKAAKQGGV